MSHNDLARSFSGLSLNCSAEALGTAKIMTCTICEQPQGLKYFPEGAEFSIEKPVCSHCHVFTVYRPCNVCFYTQPHDHYAPSEWENPRRVCLECTKQGKKTRQVK